MGLLSDSLYSFLKARPFYALLFLVLVIMGCASKPSESKFDAVLKKAHQNLIKVISLNVKEGMTNIADLAQMRTPDFVADFVAEIEWLDSVTVRRSSAFTRELRILIERGERKSTARGGFAKAWEDVALGRGKIYRRGDREKISGRFSCYKNWTGWECALLEF